MAESGRIDKERAARARAALERIGLGKTTLARMLGVHPSIVNEVLRGRLIGVRGDAHKVAVALGLKDGDILPKGASNEDVLSILRRAARKEAA
ncbi:DNA-binding protein [Pelomicrobium methylotrophicum]|uniref:DNA-binding protein n=1 Tax=Pelomicrobium methylotrophicum TaxID=2602750 RepID=A0A5C7EHZ2_9PROT|nr:DNA-binding protein [Pelomicrobium methylotrophicum]TXF11900.1 DNA-binding protein [Pelomicrobium methylotrophicum]